MADMLATELMKTGQFRLIERSEIEAVLREQDFGAGGRIRPGTEAKLGQVLGAQYMVFGAVTELNVAERGVGGGVRIGGVRLGGTVAIGTVAVDLRVVDTTSSEIVDAFSTRQKHSAQSGMRGTRHR